MWLHVFLAVGCCSCLSVGPPLPAIRLPASATSLAHRLAFGVGSHGSDPVSLPPVGRLVAFIPVSIMVPHGTGNYL